MKRVGMLQSTRILVLVIASGSILLAGASGLLLLELHRSIAIGCLGLGIVLVVGGVAMAFRSRVSGLRQTAKVSRKLSGGSRLQSVIAAAIIVGATIGSFLYVSGQVSAQSANQPSIFLTVNSASEVTYPDGRVGVNFTVSAVGGSPPYSFVASWGDSASQTSQTGQFVRVFESAPLVSTSLKITARGSGGGSGYLSLSLPSEILAANGLVTTRSLNVVASSSGNGPPGSIRTVTSSSLASTFVAFSSSTSAVPEGGPPAGASTSTSTVSGSPVSRQNGFSSSNPRVQIVSAGGRGNVTLVVNYTNGFATDVSVRLYTTVTDSAGHVVASKYFGQIVPAGTNFAASVFLGNYGTGSYTISFYILDSSTGQPISETSTLEFKVV
jgi:hypothetical protein